MTLYGEKSTPIYEKGVSGRRNVNFFNKKVLPMSLCHFIHTPD